MSHYYPARGEAYPGEYDQPLREESGSSPAMMSSAAAAASGGAGGGIDSDPLAGAGAGAGADAAADPHGPPLDDPAVSSLPRVLLMGPRRGGKTSIQVRGGRPDGDCKWEGAGFF
jgi:hypothetical protein